jgi:DNA polymerase
MKSKKEVILRLQIQEEIFGANLFVKKDEILKVSNTPEPVQSAPLSTSQLPVAPKPTLKTEQKTSLSPLKIFEESIADCQLCPLGKTRNKFVFGVGNPNADIMLIGEGPGAEEDAKGEPFVGRAGQLLNDILKAIKLCREIVYIANIVKCRPPNNRTPISFEIETCLPHLHKQIELINPKFILCLGSTAALGLLGKKESLGKMRLRVYDFLDKKVVVTYHPAALLRNPAWKKDCWEDVKLFRDICAKK